MTNIERFWYNLKADFRFWREILLGTPWAEIEGNENKSKPCLFIRFLDCIGKGVEEMGQEMNKSIEEDIKASEKFNKKLGLPPEANNAERFL